MGNRKPIFSSAACLLLTAVAFSQTTNQTPTYTMQTIYQFPLMGPANEGVNPEGLIMGLDGNLYGVTASCQVSTNCAGTFFRLTPGGSLTTIHTFTPPAETSPKDSCTASAWSPKQSVRSAAARPILLPVPMFHC